VKSYLLIN